ncbi:DUF1284 domain-containing protein [Mesorhizobium sp. ArgA1]
MTVRLRSHHLLCLLTYVGKGYSAAFVANYDAIAKRLGRGEDVLIVSGPDDICRPMLGEAESHCLGESAAGRDELAARDVGKLLARPIRAGSCFGLDAATLASLRAAFSAGVTREACQGCEWAGLCTIVAAGGYRDVRL